MVPKRFSGYSRLGGRGWIRGGGPDQREGDIFGEISWFGSLRNSSDTLVHQNPQFFWSPSPPKKSPEVLKPTVSRESFWNHSIKKWSDITSPFIIGPRSDYSQRMSLKYPFFVAFLNGNSNFQVLCVRALSVWDFPCLPCFMPALNKIGPEYSRRCNGYKNKDKTKTNRDKTMK